MPDMGLNGRMIPDEPEVLWAELEDDADDEVEVLGVADNGSDFPDVVSVIDLDGSDVAVIDVISDTSDYPSEFENYDSIDDSDPFGAQHDLYQPDDMPGL